MTDETRRTEGMRIRREVLGDPHVDRAVAATTEFTRPFQDFITRSVWGDVWARDGLERRMRSAVTLGVLVALRAEGELGMHVRAALRNGLSPDEIGEVLLHATVYAGVPAGNAAFAIADDVIADHRSKEEDRPMTLLDGAPWSGRIYDGGWVAGGGGERPVIEPATGRELGRIGMASPADVARAVGRAREAQRDWAARSYLDRGAVLRRAGDLWQQHADEVGGWIVRETDPPPKAGVELGFAASACHDAAGLTSLPTGELLPTAAPHLSLTRRVPIGVVGVISPFNFPLILSIRAVAPALALGNAVVLKPDPRTSVSGGVTLARIFEEAGLPAGLFAVLPGGADVGEALVSDPGVGLVSFTGSTRAGRLVAALAARHLKRVHLELGGNSALVILDDVDIEKAASIGAFGSFNHQGQICMTTGRHVVARAIAAQYAEALGNHARQLPVGDPATDQVALGPIIDERQRDRVHALVTDSVSAGARLVEGGTYQGLFYRPTVMADVPANAPVWREEVFGPVAPVVAFDTIDEAVALASDSPYGLSLGILTHDVMAALRMADRIPTGIVHINDQTIGDEVTNPFGGVGETGGSRLGGATANLETFTVTQWVTLRSDLPGYPF